MAAVPDEGDAEGGIAIEDEVIAEPANAGAQQAVPKVAHQQSHRLGVKPALLQ